MNEARTWFRTDIIVLALVIYGILGLATDAFVRLLERRLLVVAAGVRRNMSAVDRHAVRRAAPFDGRDDLRRHRPRHRPQRVRRPARAQRLRQEHPAAGARRARSRVRRLGARARPLDRSCSRNRGCCRGGGCEPTSSSACRATHGRRAGRRGARRGRPVGPRRRVAGHAVGRRGAARRPGPGARPRAGAAAARRAVRRARRAHAAEDARPAPGALPPAPARGTARDPRRRRGDRARRPRARCSTAAGSAAIAGSNSTIPATAPPRRSPRSAASCSKRSASTPTPSESRPHRTPPETPTRKDHHDHHRHVPRERHHRPRRHPSRTGRDHLGREWPALDIRPLSGAIGAEIRGVDLKRPLSPETYGEIRAAWLRYKVVFFPGQHLSPDEHRSFAAQFGELTPAHPVIPGIDGYPEVFEIDYGRARELYASYGDLTRRRSQRRQLAHRRHVRAASAGRIDAQRRGHPAIGRRHAVDQPGRRVRGAEPRAPGVPVDPDGRARRRGAVQRAAPAPQRQRRCRHRRRRRRVGRRGVCRAHPGRASRRAHPSRDRRAVAVRERRASRATSSGSSRPRARRCSRSSTSTRRARSSPCATTGPPATSASGTTERRSTRWSATSATRPGSSSASRSEATSPCEAGRVPVDQPIDRYAAGSPASVSLVRPSIERATSPTSVTRWTRRGCSP